jgi:hypothetical protein
MSASLEEAALEFEDPQMAIMVVLFSFCGCLEGIKRRK